MMLDIRTLAVMTALVTLGLCAALLCFWRGNRRPATLVFAVGMGLLAAGFAGIAMRQLVPPFVSIIVANSLIAAGYVMLSGGAVMLAGRRFPVVPGALVLAAHTLILACFTYVSFDVVMRIVTVSSLVLLCGAYVAVVMARAGGASGVALPRLVMAAFFAFNAFYMALRIVLTLRAGGVESFLSAGDVQSLAFLLFASSLCMIAFCVVWVAFADAQRNEIELRWRLEEKITDYEELPSVLAHDLRSPAAAVVSAVRLLRDQPEGVSPDFENSLLDLAEQSSDRLLDMLDSVMDHHVAGGERPVEPIDLEEAAQAARDNIAALIASNAADIVIEEGMPAAIANRADVIRVLQNLLQNAVKYRHPERRPEIRVAARRQGERVQLRVADNGLGIPPEKRKAVFGMFERVERDGAEGFGIGLASCHRIASALGGSIVIEDRAVPGATFLLTLPAADTVPARNSPAAPAGTVSSALCELVA